MKCLEPVSIPDKIESGGQSRFELTPTYKTEKCWKEDETMASSEYNHS